MWRGIVKDIIAFILSIVGICVSLNQFLVRDVWGSKIFALVFFIGFIYVFILIVKNIIKGRNKKQRS